MYSIGSINLAKHILLNVKKKHCLVKSEIPFPSSCVDRFIILSRAVGYRHDLDIVHDQYLIFTLP